MLIIDVLTKQFGLMKAVDNLSLRINAGEIYCLLGPNGAGKTTTLKIITGLMKPTSGTIKINGRDIQKDSLFVKQILGYIPDTPFLYENLTAREFVEFVGDVFGVDRAYVRQKINYYFELFQLEEYCNVLIKELSHGTRQKIVYTSTFIHQPKVYLIDEPLVGLDPYSIHLIKKIIKEEAAAGKTILMCTHILSLAEELGGRVGILNEGKLISEGTVVELKEQFSSSNLEEVFLKLTK